MSTQGIRAGRAYVEIGTSDRYTRGLAAAQARLNRFASNVGKLGAKTLIAATAIAAPLTASANLFASVGDELDKMSARTGVATDQLSTLGFAAQQSGTDLATLESSIRRMQKTTADAARGSDSAADALDRVGLSAAQLSGLDADDQLRLIADQIAAIPDPAERAAAAMGIFGRSGAQLLPLLSQGAAGIARLQTEADALGLSIGAADAASAAELTDAMNRARQSIRGVAISIGSALAPAATQLLDRFAAAAAAAGAWIRENHQLVTTAAAIAAGLGTAAGVLLTLAAAAKAAAFAAGGLASIGSVVSAVLGSGLVAAMAPAIPVLAAVAAGLAAVTIAAKRSGMLSDVWDSMRTRIGGLLVTVRDTFGGIVRELTSGQLGNAAEVAWAGFRVAAWTGVSNTLHAVRWLWDNALTMAVSFGQGLLQTLSNVFAAIPRLLVAALTGGQSLAEIISAAMTGGLDSVLDALDAKIAGAKQDLAELTAQTNRTAAGGPGTGRGAKPPGAAGWLDEEADAAEDSAKAIRARIQALQDEATEARIGKAAAERLRFAQAGATAAQLEALDAAQAAADAAHAENALTKARQEMADAVADRIGTLHDEIRTLRHGADAAERFKMAQAGATAAQLAALQLAQQQADAARRSAELTAAAAQLREGLRTPLEIFRDEMGRLREMADGGFVDADTANRAANKARDTLLNAAGSEEARREILAAERRRLNALVAAGKLNGEAAARALTVVGAMLDEAAARANAAGEQMNRLANTGTTSGFAAARMTGTATSRVEAAQIEAAAAAKQNLAELKGLRADLRRNTNTYT